jgi:DnaJ-class molecular chaperone
MDTAPTTDCPHCDGEGSTFEDVSIRGEHATKHTACAECGGTGREGGEGYGMDEADFDWRAA